MSKTGKRKSDHIKISMRDDVKFAKSAGFEYYDFHHFAASELVVEDVDTSVDFTGKQISYPFLISCMTGGTEEAKDINHKLAEVAKHFNVPIGVGSQRAMLEDENEIESFSMVRKIAGDVPVLANIGAAEFVNFNDTSSINKIVEAIEADVLVVHLNLLQEMVQPEGTPTFKGLVNKLRRFTQDLEVPVFAKEVGFGIGKEAALTLLEAGAKGIDVAGAGGTSWSKIEYARSNTPSNELYAEWGLPTSYCIRKVAELKSEFDFVLVGSGGIADAASFTKSLALGADISAAAGAVLKKLLNEDIDGVIKLLDNWFTTLKEVMVLTNSKNIDELKGKISKREELY